MQSRNPILSKPDAWMAPSQPQQTHPGQGYSQPHPDQGYQQTYSGQAYPPPGQPYADLNAQQFAAPVAPGRMTIEDVLTKSAITLGALVAVATLTFIFLPPRMLLPVWIVAALASFVPVLLVSFRRKINPAFVLLYAAVEGVFIGAVSKYFALVFGNGIVPAAALATLVAAATTLGAYKFFRIKVTGKFRKVVVIATLSYVGVLLVNFVLSFFGMAFIMVGNMTIWALVASAIGVTLAVLNLILDFDYIEQGIAVGADASESWRAAFGLTVTLVWLYVEMLRLLSYFRN